MNGKFKLSGAVTFFGAVLLFYPLTGCRSSEEHPQEKAAGEHPEGQQGTTGQAGEHPEEHPQEQKPVSAETLAEAISAYIQNDSALKGGYFSIYDAAAGKPLLLTLDRVHRDRLSRVAEGLYFACSDFKTPEGKTYDLDFFMRNTDRGLQVTEITIHKEEGKARYNWVEEDGVWKRR